jgi:hypothetical protein
VRVDGVEIPAADVPDADRAALARALVLGEDPDPVAVLAGLREAREAGLDPGGIVSDGIVDAIVGASRAADEDPRALVLLAELVEVAPASAIRDDARWWAQTATARALGTAYPPEVDAALAFLAAQLGVRDPG